MSRVLFVHWNREEGLRTVERLREAGHATVFHFSANADAPTWRRLKDPLPDAVVVSLVRLPSHGRRVAHWFWEAKSRRGIPILFVGGEAEKVAVARREFPAARFAREPRLLPELASALAER